MTTTPPTPNNPATTDAHLTFSQRYGYEPMPRPIIGELSADIRRKIWDEMSDAMANSQDAHDAQNPLTGTRYEGLSRMFRSLPSYVKNIIGDLYKIPQDEVRTSYNEVRKEFRAEILQGEFHVVITLLELMINSGHFGDGFTKSIRTIFEEGMAAYSLDLSHRPYQFIPRASKEQGEAIAQALETLRESGMDVSGDYLRKAAKHMNAGRFPESIVASINAVESVVHKIAPNESNKFGTALASLENVHQALKEACKKLYGYASQPGLRHAGPSEHGIDEALFMFGACASFAAYLAAKRRDLQQN